MSQYSIFRSRKHPYYPLNAQIPNYVPNEKDLTAIFGPFAATCVLVLSATALFVKYSNPRIVKSDVAITLWFVLSGCIHVLFEGYFVLNFADLPSQQTIRAQLWKEYALSDSRYLTKNAFVICIESITAIIIGPLSLYTALQTARSRPSRHTLQLAVSLLHLYSDMLYYGTALVEAKVNRTQHSRPEALYFWGYFIGANGLWIAVPLFLIHKSTRKPMKAITAFEKSERRVKNMGLVGWRNDMINSLRRKEQERVAREERKAIEADASVQNSG